MKVHALVFELVPAAVLILATIFPIPASADRGHSGPALRQMQAPGPMHAPRPGGGGVDGHGHGHMHGVPFPPPHRRFVPGYPSYGYALPYSYGSSYGLPYFYDSPDPAPAPPASYSTVYVAAPPAVPPALRVVDLATGRYELQGDGVYAPYTWVWIPNAPAAPPAPEPPPPPPAAPPAPPVATAPTPARPNQLYRWVDADGVVHLTDIPETVPAQFRKPVGRN